MCKLQLDIFKCGHELSNSQYEDISQIDENAAKDAGREGYVGEVGSNALDTASLDIFRAFLSAEKIFNFKVIKIWIPTIRKLFWNVIFDIDDTFYFSE